MNLNQQTHDTALETFIPELVAATNHSTVHSTKPMNLTPAQKPEIGFHDLGIDPKIVKELDRLNFTTPTPIQKKSIPAGIKGDDIIAIAQTGSGKTLAFGIPMLQRLAQNLSDYTHRSKNNRSRNQGMGLVLVPTRELAIQVEESLKTISRSMRMSSVVLIGGAPMHPQIQALRRNPRMIIATPGRLVDHIERGTADLSRVEVFVLDEADRMLDMGFVPDIKKVIKVLPAKRQMMLYSATMPSEVESIAKKMMDKPVRIESDRSGAIPSKVSHEMFFINNHDKSRLLSLQLKERTGPVLIFTRTKRMAAKLTTRVNKMGFSAAEIHSDRSLGQRRFALEGFKRGRFQVLVATDIAARGIDVTGIELVVNYDMPANSEDYVHRIGRTGRAGKTGHAVSYANVDQKGTIRSIERLMKAKLTVSSLPILPSEKFMLQEAEKNQKNRPQADSYSDSYSSERKSSRTRPSRNGNSRGGTSRDGDFKRGDSRKYAAKREDSRRTYSDRLESRRSATRSQDSSSNGSPAPVTRAPRVKTAKSAVKKTLTQILASAEADQGETVAEKSFWSTFKKKRLTKKKSVGQGASRKRHTKRK